MTNVQDMRGHGPCELVLSLSPVRTAGACRADLMPKVAWHHNMRMRALY